MAEMTLQEAIRGRRSVRAYADEPLGEARLRALLEAAVRAPTAMHVEPWAFAVVEDRRLLDRLSERAKALVLESGDEHARSLVSLPGFHVFYDARTLIVIGARSHNPFVAADCWLAAENLMLTAYGMGLGSCVIGFAVGALQLPAVKSELGIPAEVTPIAPIIVGVPRGETPLTARRPPDIVSWRR